MEKLLYGLVPFAGAIFAVLLYRGALGPEALILSLLAAAGCGSLAWLEARHMPRFSAIVVNGYLLLPICLIAIATIAVMYLTLKVPGVLGDPEDEEVKTLAGVIVGAATAWFASLWTEDIAKGEGRFFPGGLVRHAWRKKFKGDRRLNAPRDADAETAYAALFEDSFAEGDGWGPVALFQRASLVSRWLS